MFLLNSWGRVLGKPTLRHKLFHNLLLFKIEGEKFSTDLLESLWVATRLKLPLHPLQLEEPLCGEGHTEPIDAGCGVEEEEIAYSTIDFYGTSEIPGVIAIVRFTTSDDNERVFDVTEAVYGDTLEGFCALEKDVPEALLHGIDVAVMSHVEPEEFPEINAFLGDATEV
jgi:hypothetical protein